MHINDIRQFAKQMNVNTFGMNKTDIIRSVQRAENNFGCFATERLEHCNEHACLWREDCISANNKQ
jgi:hypothetical protein